MVTWPFQNQGVTFSFLKVALACCSVLGVRGLRNLLSWKEQCQMCAMLFDDDNGVTSLQPALYDVTFGRFLHSGVSWFYETVDRSQGKFMWYPERTGPESERERETSWRETENGKRDDAHQGGHPAIRLCQLVSLRGLIGKMKKVTVTTFLHYTLWYEQTNNNKKDTN